MKTLKIIGVIVALAVVIDYWQWFLVAGLIAGACYWRNEARKARIARHAACLADIARLERELRLV